MNFVSVERQERVFAYTGSDPLEWAGHKTGENFGSAENRRVEPEVVEVRFKAYETARAEEVELAERLLRAHEAAQAAGVIFEILRFKQVKSWQLAE